MCEESKAEGVQSANAGVCVQKRVECDDGTPARMRVLIYLLGPSLVSTLWLTSVSFDAKSRTAECTTPEACCAVRNADRVGGWRYCRFEFER